MTKCIAHVTHKITKKIFWFRLNIITLSSQIGQGILEMEIWRDHISRVEFQDSRPVYNAHTYS